MDDAGPTNRLVERRGWNGKLWVRWRVYLVMLALLATNTALLWQDRHRVLEHTHVANTNLAHAVSERLEGAIAQVDQILDALVYEIERSELSAAALAPLQPILVNHVARTEQLKGLFVYDATGAWVATSEPTWPAGANNADRPYFKHHKDNQSGLVLLGPPIVSRSSGRWVLPLSRRLNDRDGAFAGVVLATLDLEHVRHVLDRFTLGGGAITVLAAGHHMTRRPFVGADVGKSARAVMDLLGPHASGSGDARSPIDGVTRLYSFEKTRSYPVRVIVAAAKAEALRGWWLNSLLQSTWVLLLCIVLKRGNDYTRKAMRQRREAEERIRSAHSALAQANQSLEKLAQFDELTGLPNRRYFSRRLAKTFKQAQRDGRPTSAAMVDVDHFKKYNDHYGHVEGDRCLQLVAQALQSALQRPDDFIARYGGEEFVLLLRDTDARGAAVVAEAARAAVARLALPHAMSELGVVSVSLGLATASPGAKEDTATLIQRADAALYMAKQQGRNRVGVSDP
ncbi:sensor domain-containing diguanylate cyclase [Pseudorhodoferax sp. Leaf267]|uniref:sensor domain-containing diguanylate cyclase n=1 Tax=Pseudorhodoferax sp. Leaf267 TaxID=1736316 RepID=UPI00138F8096|nr:sensor domain-containing diguanylate cyclase [Pseudorhodoferax sp. Leaf267]